MFQIDAHSGMPIYRQIVDQLRRLIYSGTLAAGDKIPSVREVAVEHAINPMTVSKAYALAESDGLLLRQRGKAMQVATQNHKSITSAERLQQLEPLIGQLISAAKQLNLESDQIQGHVNTLWDENNND